MKCYLVIIVLISVLFSCSEEETVLTPEPCDPFFSAESLKVEVHFIYLPLLDIWLWEANANYKYEFHGCSGKIDRHEFKFIEPDFTGYNRDNTIPDCFVQIGEPHYNDARLSASNDLFDGLDSVTVYFTLRGIFQQCSGGLADTIAAIVWSDTVRADVKDK